MKSTRSHYVSLLGGALCASAHSRRDFCFSLRVGASQSLALAHPIVPRLFVIDNDWMTCHAKVFANKIPVRELCATLLASTRKRRVRMTHLHEDCSHGHGKKNRTTYAG